MAEREKTIRAGLRTVRTLHNWTQEDLAARAGRSRELIGHYERGLCSIPSPVAERLAEVLHTTMEVVCKLTRTNESLAHQGTRKKLPYSVPSLGLHCHACGARQDVAALTIHANPTLTLGCPACGTLHEVAALNFCLPHAS